MNWSPYQLAIFDAVAHTNDSLIIEAVAGSGKTTTIVEAINHVPSNQSVCFLAFNKSIATELSKRVTAPNAKCMTLHAAGWAAWRRAVSLEGLCEVDGRKTGKILEELVEQRKVTEGERWKYGGQLGKLLGYAKGAGIVPKRVEGYRGLVEDTDDAWFDLIDHYGMDEDEVSIDLARMVLAESIVRGKDICDFDEMLYLPIVSGVPFERYDVVFCDEAQDISGIQMEMLSRMLQGGGRLICVGDSHQAIYQWRGAQTNSMQQIQERFGCRPLPLSISYRCPKSVVIWAQQWVQHLEWAGGAEDGYVGAEGTDWAGQAEIALGAPLMQCLCGDRKEQHIGGGRCMAPMCGCLSYVPEYKQTDECDLEAESGISKFRGALEDFRAGDAILCRVNRPLVALAFRLIRARVPSKVLGRDIGQGLVGLVRKLLKNAPSGDLRALGEKLDQYRQKEQQRLGRRKRWAELASLEDRLATLEEFMGEVDSVDQLIREIEGLFAEGVQGVVLSSIHKAKGMEWSRVFVLDAGQYQPSPWAKRDWELEGERCLQYVAATRAKAELRYITSAELVDSRSSKDTNPTHSLL
jgi:superfamily I DNA/RNA helicase